MMFCLVRTEPEAQACRNKLYINSNGYSGIEIRPLVDMTLNAGFNEVFFTDVTVPEEILLVKEKVGLLQMQHLVMKGVHSPILMR